MTVEGHAPGPESTHSPEQGSRVVPDPARVAKYAKAIDSAPDTPRPMTFTWGDWVNEAEAVIAVADAERAVDAATITELREWQREVCDQFGYDSNEPGNAAEVLAYLPFWRGEAAGYAEALQAAEARVARVEALADSLVWKRPEKCPCGDPVSCCGSEFNCAAMRPSVSLVGHEDIRAALAEPTEQAKGGE